MTQRKLSKIWGSCTACLLAAAPHSCTAFQTIHGHHTRNLFTSYFATSSHEEDGPSDVDGDGEELAGQFYDQLKRRANSDQQFEPISQLPQQEVDDTLPRPVVKFTGANSPSLFSDDDQSASTNLQREREREFTLAGNFERTLGIQVAILIASIVFVASVGLSGGITDGSDRNFGGADDLLGDTVMEQIYSLRTDDAAEVISRQSIQESQW